MSNIFLMYSFHTLYSRVYQVSFGSAIKIIAIDTVSGSVNFSFLNHDIYLSQIVCFCRTKVMSLMSKIPISVYSFMLNRLHDTSIEPNFTLELKINSEFDYNIPRLEHFIPCVVQYFKADAVFFKACVAVEHQTLTSTPLNCHYNRQPMELTT